MSLTELTDTEMVQMVCVTNTYLASLQRVIESFPLVQLP